MDEPTPSKPSGGCFSKLLFLVLLISAGLLGTALFFVVQPQDLSDIEGRKPAAAGESQRDLAVVLKNAVDRGYPVTLTEGELNQWLARTLELKQGGLPADKASLDRILVRLEEGMAEVIMVRTVMGKPFTVSMFLQVERMEGQQGTYTEVTPHGGPFHPDVPNPPKGGRFGKLVVPQGFLILVMPSYKKLAETFPDEIELAFRQMSRIRIEEHKIILDPREPLGVEGIPRTF